MSPLIDLIPGHNKFGSLDNVLHAPQSNDAHNLLRPETIESLWYLHYFTRNETYRNWAWDIFVAFEEHTKARNLMPLFTQESVIDPRIWRIATLAHWNPFEGNHDFPQQGSSVSVPQDTPLLHPLVGYPH